MLFRSPAALQLPTHGSWRQTQDRRDPSGLGLSHLRERSGSFNPNERRTLNADHAEHPCRDREEHADPALGAISARVSPGTQNARRRGAQNARAGNREAIHSRRSAFRWGCIITRRRRGPMAVLHEPYATIPSKPSHHTVWSNCRQWADAAGRPAGSFWCPAVDVSVSVRTQRLVNAS